RSGLVGYRRRYPGHRIDSIADFRRNWREGHDAGADWAPQVFAGLNPLGNDADILQCYRGFIRIDHPGEYHFFTASTDASFLLLGGKPVASWPGRHGVYEGLRGRYGGTVTLSPGDYDFEYLHANNRNVFYEIAAWLPPGAKKPMPIPAAAFTPVLSTRVGTLLRPDGKPRPDFTWTAGPMLEADGYRMFPLRVTPVGAVHSWRWGDGTSSSGTATAHYYFTPGDYTVTMRTSSGTMRQQVAVAPRYDLAPPDDTAAVTMVKGALHQEETSGLPPEGYRFLAEALPALKLTQSARSFYRKLLQQREAVAPDVVMIFFRRLVLDDMLQREQYEAAERELQHLLVKLQSGEALAEARLAYAELLLDCRGQSDPAAAVLAAVDRAQLSEERQADFDRLQADMTLYRDGYTTAMDHYLRMKSRRRRMTPLQAVQAGGMLIDIRNHLVLKHFREAEALLDRLFHSYPEYRMDSTAMLLRSQVLSARKRPRAAAVGLERVLRLHPDRQTEIEADLALGRYWYEQHDLARARQYLRVVREKAPHSREAVTAEKIWHEMVGEEK
ncbi:MAG: hypothetical protein PHQ27_06285, partial [Victivallales bacterium]|nr:hypothetical protein [Victivallales bacterium]